MSTTITSKELLAKLNHNPDEMKKIESEIIKIQSRRDFTFSRVANTVSLQAATSIEFLH